MVEQNPLGGDLLAWAAARAANWPHLFSGLIAHYQELHNLTDADLCARLQCDRDTLNHLRLCGRPDPDPALAGSGPFALDIQRVADKLGLNAGMLASIVREVDVADAFGAARQTILPFSSMHGMLQAARDHDLDKDSRLDEQGPPVVDEDTGENPASDDKRQEGDDLKDHNPDP